jgi:hypothetical protein
MTPNFNGIGRMLTALFQVIFFIFHEALPFGGAAAATIAAALGGLFWGTLDAMVVVSGTAMLIAAALIWAYLASPV